MDESFKLYLRDYVERITKKSKGKNLYICPLCKSGTGKHKTGAFSIKDDTRWKCFSCGESGDILDLIGKYEGITDKKEQFKRLEEIYGKQQNTPRTPPRKEVKYTRADPATVNYKNFFLQANKNIEKTSYHRGISIETLNRFKIGYVEEWRHPKAPSNAPTSPRLIIPTSKESYLARDTRDKIPENQKDYSKSKVGKLHIFNADALKTAEKPVFIVEGELDALSIIDVGGAAVALGSTTKTRDFLELLKTSRPKTPLIIALDNDAAGKKASEELTDGLKRLKISFYRFNPAGEYKDANEALQANREALRQSVEKAEYLQQSEAERAKKAEKDALLATAANCHVGGLKKIMVANAKKTAISTGFKRLDSVFGNKLREGLVIVGGISSLGKTSFILQLADQIAQNELYERDEWAGRDVLFFSLEMSEVEIMTKTISRHTLQLTIGAGEDIKNAKTAQGILEGGLYESYSKLEKEIIDFSVEAYEKHADHVWIIEGDRKTGVDYIREKVEKFVYLTGRTPVVFVDYLQILAPYDARATDKRNTDDATAELRRISKDFHTLVVCTSSLNRANYSSAISMEAFKESGGIEFSSDILIGLQLKGVGDKNFDVNEAKKKNPREVELFILKNRNGKTGDKIAYEYYPAYNFFMESELQDEI